MKINVERWTLACLIIVRRQPFPCSLPVTGPPSDRRVTHIHLLKHIWRNSLVFVHVSRQFLPTHIWHSSMSSHLLVYYLSYNFFYNVFTSSHVHFPTHKSNVLVLTSTLTLLFWSHRRTIFPNRWTSDQHHFFTFCCIKFVYLGVRICIFSRGVTTVSSN